MHPRCLGALRPLLLLLSVAACTDSGGEDQASPGPFATGSNPAVADASTPGATDAGANTPSAIDSGTHTPATIDAGTHTPVTIDSGTPSGADAGGVADAGAGDAGDAGSTTKPSGDCLCRGDDPTEDDTMKNGPYKVESYTDGFMRASGVDSSTVWYPSDADPPFAGVAVVPGFVSPESSIQEWGPFLASHGIVAVTIGVPGSDYPDVRAMKLLGTLESLKAENTRSGSPLMGQLDLTRLAVAGWSMGGGGTLIAASQTPDLKAAVSFAAWGPTGGAMDTVPVLMFEGTADILAAGMSEPYYNDVPDSTPKMVFEVQGAPHEVANSPKNSNGVIGSYGLSWFKVFLEGDERYRQFLTKPFPSICTSTCATNLTK